MTGADNDAIASYINVSEVIHPGHKACGKKAGNMTMLRTLQKTSAGFTFTEVLLVIAIIAILIAVTAPAYAKFYQGQSLKTLHDAILFKLREAPPLAKALRRPVYVAIDIDNDKAWLEIVPNVTYGQKVPTTVAASADIKGIANSTTPLTTGVARYEFRYWGTCTETGTNNPPSLTIHIGDRNTAYVSTADEVKFRTITITTESSRAKPYNVGCGGSAGSTWGTWPECNTVDN